MTRRRYRINKKTGELAEVFRAPYRAIAPSLRTDTIPLEYNHGTGRWHDSRSDRKFWMDTMGVEPVAGDYQAKWEDQDNTKDIEKDLKEAVNDIRWGNNGLLTAEEKNDCKVIDERLGWNSGK